MMHYLRWKRYGDPNRLGPHAGGSDPLKSSIAWTHEETCSVQGCNQPYHARGFCTKHYSRWRATGNPLPKEKPLLQCSCGAKITRGSKNCRSCATSIRNRIRYVGHVKKKKGSSPSPVPGYASRASWQYTYWQKAHPEKAKAKHKRYRMNNKEKVRAEARRHNLKKNFGISPEDFELLLEEQNGLCGLCGKTVVENKRRFAVDHDHQTGIVRGLLCTACNVRVGWIDSIGEQGAKEWLERAVAWKGEQNPGRLLGRPFSVQKSFVENTV